MRPGPHEQPECQPAGVISTALFAGFVGGIDAGGKE